ncbi:hypothetical protein ACXYTJ_10190 [Gilvimarinus sp. F26214L]|uniref:hypothetical protein n=1 Tax=Gilvimarinus sp. DZF01 TaxID=3461371 RepID=UPI00404581C6
MRIEVEKKWLYRSAAFVLCCAAVFWGYQKTGSLFLAFSAGAAVCFSYGFLVLLYSTLRGQALKRFLAKSGKSIPVGDVDLDSNPPLQDFVYFNDNSYASAITVSREGIYIYSFGLFSCLLPWESIANLYVLDRGSKSCAQVLLNCPESDSRKLIIGWEKKFDQYVPSSTAINKR